MHNQRQSAIGLFDIPLGDGPLNVENRVVVGRLAFAHAVDGGLLLGGEGAGLVALVVFAVFGV